MTLPEYFNDWNSPEDSVYDIGSAINDIHATVAAAVKNEQDRIIKNIMDRVQDLKSCHKTDNCNELGDMIESYIEEWIG